jgi:hypothetical protein
MLNDRLFSDISTKGGSREEIYTRYSDTIVSCRLFDERVYAKHCFSAGA